MKDVAGGVKVPDKVFGSLGYASVSRMCDLHDQGPGHCVVANPGQGGEGGLIGQKQVCPPEIDLQLRAPVINYHFPEGNFSDVGGLYN